MRKQLTHVAAALAGAYLALMAVSAVGLPCKPTTSTTAADLKQAYAAGYAAAVADGAGNDPEDVKP